jgi:hypothetical protein
MCAHARQSTFALLTWINILDRSCDARDTFGDMRVSCLSCAAKTTWDGGTRRACKHSRRYQHLKDAVGFFGGEEWIRKVDKYQLACMCERVSVYNQAL